MEETTGSGKWAQPGVPHKGWTCVNVEDLGEPSAVCEMCERMEIRYVHYMEHPDYPGHLGCGCVCAGHMEEDYDRARDREKALRNAAARRNRWLSRNWRTSAKGNDYLNVDGYNVVVFHHVSGWSYFVKNVATGTTFKPRRPFPASDNAKLAAFDTMIWMKNTGQ